jgi:hypothetical protein
VPPQAEHVVALARQLTREAVHDDASQHGSSTLPQALPAVFAHEPPWHVPESPRSGGGDVHVWPFARHCPKTQQPSSWQTLAVQHR